MGEQLKVLVVDDDRRMVKTICDILFVKGFEATAAYTGEEAVEKVALEKPGCVLMDLKMPGIDGVEALKAVREAAPDLPVLLMSAYATEEQVEEAKRQGAYALLSKPLDIQGVLAFLALLRKEESILVVDDDPLFCQTLKDILQATGYRVETEGEAANVLGHMERNYKLAVLLDLKLGTAEGVSVLQEIRAKYPTKPVVLMTGYREEMGGAIEQGLRIGAYSCLYKPFEIEGLIRIIEEISREKLRKTLVGAF
jgi:DNA-binding NtrC family response regulator